MSSNPFQKRREEIFNLKALRERRSITTMPDAIPIQQRKEGTDEILSYEVSGDKIQSVIMLPGYTHNIINLSDTQDLVTVMYCNEIFNPDRPDTYGDPVVRK